MYEMVHNNKNLINALNDKINFKDGNINDEMFHIKDMLTDFEGNIKQQMFDQLGKFKLDTLIINQFIIRYNSYDMVTRRSLR